MPERTPTRFPRARRAVLLAAVLVAWTAGGAAAAPAARLDLTPGQWREDLETLAAQLQRRHAKAFHFVSPEAFQREVASIDSAIPALDGYQVFARLKRLTAMIGDGHTGVHPPATFTSYPFGLRRFGDHFRVIRTLGAADSVLGMRLVSVDGAPAAAVAAGIEALIAQDEGAALRQATAPLLMTLGGMLRGIGAARDIRRASFVFEDDGGRQVTLVLAPDVPSQSSGWRLTSQELPLYRTRRDQTLFYIWLPEGRTVYCNFRSYDGLAAKARALFEFVDRHPVDRLVIDLRQNGGGDFHQGLRHMVEPVLARPHLNREGHLFVIIGPLTYSAALANTIHFRDRTEAMLVGEPIGEKPNSWSENDEFVLPHSRLTVSYSTKYYAFAPGEEFIAPDRRIAPTWEEFRDGRDPVLEWILTCCR